MHEDLFSFPVAPHSCTGMRWSVLNYFDENPIVAVSWLNNPGDLIKHCNFEVDKHDVSASRAWIIDGLVANTARIIKAKTIPQY